MNVYKVLIGICTLLLLSGCAVFESKPPITQEEVVTMVKAGTSPGEIIQKLKASGTIYELSAAELIDLSRKGVPDSILNYMQSTQIQAIRQENARRDFYYPAPYPYWYDRRYYYPWWY